MNRRLILPSILFLLSLVLFFFAGKSYIHTNNFISSSVITTGTIEGYDKKMLDGSISYSPIVSFHTESGTVKFTSEISSDTKKYQINDKVRILYNMKKPHEAEINSFFSLWFNTITFLFMAICATVPLVSILWRFHIRKSINRRLDKVGMTISAKVIDIYKSKMITGNRRQYIIKAVGQNGENSYIFKSYAIWSDPSDYVKQGDYVDVLVDKRNPRKYIMDTSFLPKIK